MLRIMSFHRPEIQGGAGTQLAIESDEFMGGGADIRYLLADGILETYLDRYGFPAGASLTALLLDAFYDDIDMPHWQEPGALDRFEEIVAMGPDRIEWRCDKNELLSTVTLAADDPETVAGSWNAIRRDHAEKAEGWVRLQEERAADEFISVMTSEQRSQPRDPEPASTSQTVESGITFVP